MYTLIETCCGSAALTLHLLGARRPLVPYQGGKWRVRRHLAEVLHQRGFRGPPRRVELYDVGPWGVVIGAVVDARARQALIGHLDGFGRRDPREVFGALQGGVVPSDPSEVAAQYLFLQRLSYSGKAVGIRDGRWSSPGFNASSAYGLPGTDRFGAVLPMIPSLIRVLTDYATLRPPEELTSARDPAPRPASSCASTVVYIDPPYAGSTAYPNGDLSRAEVSSLALAWAAAGALVVVSEGEPLADLQAAGWSASRLALGRDDTSPFRGKQHEWVTISP